MLKNIFSYIETVLGPSGGAQYKAARGSLCLQARLRDVWILCPGIPQQHECVCEDHMIQTLFHQSHKLKLETGQLSKHSDSIDG